MEFDRSAIRHAPTVAVWDPNVFDVFVRSDAGTVEHYWATDGVMFGPEPLGPGFSTDPVAIWESDDAGSHLHLIGRAGIQLVDWHWTLSTHDGFLRAPTVETLPGFCVTTPAVVNAGRIEVFARGFEGLLRHWSHTADGWLEPEVLSTDVAASDPIAVSRSPGIIDVFAWGGTFDGLRHWRNTGGTWASEPRGGGQLTGRPTVASTDPDRLDVFALRPDGVPLHWGWDGHRDQWFDAENRLAMTFGASSSVTARPELSLVAFGPNLLILVARSTDDELVEWTFEAPNRWAGVNPFSSSAHPFFAWSSQDRQVDVLSRAEDGTFTHDFFVNDPAHGMGEPVAGGWDTESLVVTEPAPPPRILTTTPVDPDVLVTRPDDLVVLGLRWTNLDVDAGVLVAGPGAELTVLFPPQHVVEQVLAEPGDGTPGLDLASTDDIPTWHAALSGASRVVVQLDAGQHVPLTAEGVLDALRRGTVVPSDGVLDGKTALELPYRLLISPHTADNGPIRSTHPAGAVASASGSVGIWQTTIAADGTPAGAPAGLVLHAIDAGSDDPFAVALTGGSRARIALEAPTATIDRLALSALGGTLEAAGSWESFDWAHAAAAGRDRRVRTSTRGVLYPFGHEAEYVEVTERIFESSADGAVAHLRKRRTLRVVEVMRREPDDAALRAAFPFHEVEHGRTVFDELDEPAWETQPLPVPELEQLQSNLAQWQVLAQPIYEALFGDMGPGPDDPPIEDLAAGGVPGADDPLDPDDPDRTRSGAAQEYLNIVGQMDWVNQQIDVLPHGGVDPLDVFFVPRVGRSALQFPIRFAGTLGDVHVTLPLIFVARIDRPRGLLTESFSSLTDDSIRGRLADAYRAEGDGVAEVGGTRIDLVRSADRGVADACEVHRLHVVGVGHDGGFRPRLGAEPEPDEQAVPAAARWGFDVVLPAVRTLLGNDRAPLRMAFSRAVLDRAADIPVPFQVPDGAPKLVTDFVKNSARSGGIVAPDIVADGISRLHGPVNVAGLLDGVGTTLDPKKVLGDGATLLGFNLADLIDASALTVPPSILHADPPSLQVTLTWSDVKLRTESGPFVTGPDSKVDINVVVGVDGQTITCTVEHIVLAFPDRDDPPKLIEVSLDKIVFTQHGNQPPTLDVDGVSATFFGILKLLKDLQDAVDLGNSAPTVDASSSGVTASYTLPVPDVATGGFQLTGLVFHAGIDVPFDERPVVVSIAFASREKPFNLSVLMFGGGGYVDVEIDRTGLRKLELALEFGASVSVDFVVASGEVHALGGVSIVDAGGHFSLTGYLRFGGSVHVLGLITVSVELRVTLTYHDDTNQMVGRATLVLEVDLTLVSDSVELDTGDWVLAGASSAREQFTAAPMFTALDAAEVPDEWRRYRAAFAPGSVGP